MEILSCSKCCLGNWKFSIRKLEIEADWLICKSFLQVYMLFNMDMIRITWAFTVKIYWVATLFVTASNLQQQKELKIFINIYYFKVFSRFLNYQNFNCHQKIVNDKFSKNNTPKIAKYTISSYIENSPN